MSIKIVLLFLSCSIIALNARAPCTDEQVQSFKTLVETCRTFPQNESSLKLGVSIIQTLPQGLAGNTSEFVEVFDAIAFMFAQLFNISLNIATVDDIRPEQLYATCQVYNAISATPHAPYAALKNFTALLESVRYGVLNSLSPQPRLSNFSSSYYYNNTPGAVRLALVPGGMVVSWQTVNPYIHRPAVLYSTAADDLNLVTRGTTHTYGTAYFHDVVLNNLRPGRTYYYSIVGDVAKKVYQFKTPSRDQRKPYEVTVLGDMGYINAKDTHKSVLDTLHKTDLFIHIGDISYADTYYLRPEFAWTDTYEETWNVWQQWMMPITSNVPYMVLPGNHEAACQLLYSNMVCPVNQQNFTAYRHRFRMPSEESGAGKVENMWSSFDYGLVHYVMIDTETDFPNSPEGPGKETAAGPFGGGANPTQLEWLEKDLRKANSSRHFRPWIVVIGHRPIYTGIIINPLNTGSLDPAVPAAFEPLLAKYNVDIYLAGHLHFYERLYPISNGVSQCYDGNVYQNPTAPTYIINGAAGNDQRLRQVTYNYTLGSYYNNRDYGYGKLLVHNHTHIEWQYIRSATRAIDDDLWIVKPNNRVQRLPHHPYDDVDTNDNGGRDDRWGRPSDDDDE